MPRSGLRCKIDTTLLHSVFRRGAQRKLHAVYTQIKTSAIRTKHKRSLWVNFSKMRSASFVSVECPVRYPFYLPSLMKSPMEIQGFESCELRTGEELRKIHLHLYRSNVENQQMVIDRDVSHWFHCIQLLQNGNTAFVWLAWAEPRSLISAMFILNAAFSRNDDLSRPLWFDLYREYTSIERSAFTSCNGREVFVS